MNRTLPPVPPSWLTPLGVAAAPLAALLSFSVQLLLAKHLLPLYGGTPSVWIGANLYFQLTLVLGYGWAVWLLTRAPRVQAGATIGLGLLALITFHLPGNAADTPTISLVVARLALGSLPAMLLLFSVSPLLHGWLRGPDGKPPYQLYALSNAGSLAGLAAYPFLVEPFIGLDFQVQTWRALLSILTALLALAAAVIWTRRADSAAVGSSALTSATDASASEPFPWKRVPLWLGLSALGVLHLLAATHHVSAEIGSHPLAWVGPLGLYLLGFTFAFSSRWRPWMTQVALAVLGLGLAGFMVNKGFANTAVRGPSLIWLGMVSASGGFLGAALLSHSRPSSRPEWFYLALGLGGSGGGLAAAHLVPALFPVPIELCFTSVLFLLAGLLWLSARRTPAVAAVLLVVTAAPVVMLGLHQLRDRAEGIENVLRLRDEQGNLTLEFSATSVVLSSDATTHGSQLTETAESRRRPTLYYTENSPLGRSIIELQAARPSIRIGAVGLGAGTLAAYARDSDTVDFWDIDPKSIRVAQEFFTFISDSPGTVNLLRADGRKALEQSTDDYDLLLIDAFTGDAIPPHLLTREAMQTAFARLKARNGVLVIHTSSRSADYFPVLDATARSLGLGAIGVGTHIESVGANSDWDRAEDTDYVVIFHPDRFFEVLAWFPTSADEDRVTRALRVNSKPVLEPRHIWTDDRNATLDVLDLGRYLFDR